MARRTYRKPLMLIDDARGCPHSTGSDQSFAHSLQAENKYEDKPEDSS
jgi:hypothetical protein